MQGSDKGTKQLVLDTLPTDATVDSSGAVGPAPDLSTNHEVQASNIFKEGLLDICMYLSICISVKSGISSSLLYLFSLNLKYPVDI